MAQDQHETANETFGDHIDTLAADVEEAIRRLQADDSQFNRRVLVRVIFSYYEGFGYFMREFLIKILATSSSVVDLNRCFLLQEKLPAIGVNGEMVKRAQKVPFLDHLAFTLQTFARLIKFDEAIFRVDGWRAVQASLKIRDRLTHPKTQRGLTVSDSDIEFCKKGYEWFADLMTKQFREATSNLTSAKRQK